MGVVYKAEDSELASSPCAGGKLSGDVRGNGRFRAERNGIPRPQNA